MIGPLEIAVIIVILLLIFHKRLPGLGRSAGNTAKIGSEKAREFADKNTPKAKQIASQVGEKGTEVGAKVGDRIDPKEIGRKAGSAAREARDMRSEFKSFLDPPPKKESAPGPAGDAARRPDAPAAPAAAIEPETPAAPTPTAEPEAPAAETPVEDEPGPAADAERREESGPETSA